MFSDRTKVLFIFKTYPAVQHLIPTVVLLLLFGIVVFLCTDRLQLMYICWLNKDVVARFFYNL